MREGELQDLVVAAARSMGLLCYHTYDSRRSEPGFPDLVIVGSRNILFRELKSATGRLSPTQVYWLGALELTGADVEVWRPADWPVRITRELSALGRSKMPRPEPSQMQLRKKLATRKK